MTNTGNAKLAELKFTTPCFIRKNTTDLQDKLKDLGYFNHPTMINVDPSSQYLFCNRGFFAGFPIGYQEEIDRAIDCGTNEKLFLAIAGLRSDTDKHQWFISPEGTWVYNKGYEDISEVSLKWRKAQIEEIIEYFKE